MRTINIAKIAVLATAVEATRVTSQANVQEVAQLIQEALAKSGEKLDATLHSNIENALQQTIKTEQKSSSSEGSKLGFLQKVISLDCFFGSSNCLFKDKKALMAGEITNLAQKKIEQANNGNNTTTTAALAQIKTEVAAATNAKKVSHRKTRHFNDIFLRTCRLPPRRPS